MAAFSSSSRLLADQLELSDANRRVLIEACNILDVPTDLVPHLKIHSVSKDGRLVIIGADREAELTDAESRAIRGVVLDMKERIVVSRTSYYAVPARSSDSLFTKTEDGIIETINVLTDDGEVRSLPFDNCIALPHTEGVRINIFLHNGEVFTVTHTNLDVRAKHGGRQPGWRPGTPSFAAQFDSTFVDHADLERHLFPEGCLYSPWVYSFYVVHPARALTSKLRMGDQGFVIYYGATCMWDVVTGPFKMEDDPADPRPYMGTVHDKPFDMANYASPLDNFARYTKIPFDRLAQIPRPDGFLVIPPGDLLRMTLNNREIEDVLNYGVPNPTVEYRAEIDKMHATQDWRLLPGESVMILYIPDDGIPERFHVRSSAYLYRAIINQDTPKSDFSVNPYLCFHLFLSNAFLNLRNDNKLENFLSNVPPVKVPPREAVLRALVNGETLTSSELYKTSELVKMTRGQLIEIVAHVYVLAANGHNQLMAFRFLDRYFKDKENVIRWTIQQKGNTRIYTSDREGRAIPKSRLDAYKRLTSFIKLAKQEAKKTVTAKEINPRTRKPYTVVELENNTISRKIMASHGMMFYNMVAFVYSMTGQNTTNISDPNFVAPATQRSSEPRTGVTKRDASLSRVLSVLNGEDVSEPQVNVDALIESELAAPIDAPAEIDDGLEPEELSHLPQDEEVIY